MKIFSCDVSNYLDQVAEEINDTLQESGQVVISELSKTFSFAADFLLEVHVIHYFKLMFGLGLPNKKVMYCNF